MDCRETQTLLTAFHDGELPAVERGRVEEHLRGCPDCVALLADMARADRAAGVPDPGPAYWDRFNARVMDRVKREAGGPKVMVLRPNGGWMRQQLRYLVPAAAVAALVLVVVRYGGMNPGVPTPAVPPAVSEPAAPVPGEKRVAKAEPESRATMKPEGAAGARKAPPPLLPDDRFVAVREDRNLLADRSPPAGNEAASRERAAAPAAVGAPAPAAVPGPEAPGGSPAVTEAGGEPRGMLAERKKMEGAAAQRAERQAADLAKSASGMSMSKEQAAEAPPAASPGKTRLKAGPASHVSASAPAPAVSPCELARTLAARERWREAEDAQRACLGQDRSARTQEKGLVFLAELLDRQARFADADAVIAEIDRQFPQSRPLDLYRQQRPMVQKPPAAAPSNR